MKIRKTKEQAKAIKEYNFALQQEDRYLGSVFANESGKTKYEDKTKKAYEACIALGMTHEHGL